MWLHDEPSLGERLAQRTVSFLGSWKFLMAQATLMAAWVIWNTVGNGFDRWPFSLMNLFLSTQAAFTGPLILIAQARQTRLEGQHQMEILRLLSLQTCQLAYLQEGLSEEGGTWHTEGSSGTMRKL